MEYLVFALAMAGFVVVIFVMEIFRAQKKKKEFIRYLYEDYERIIEKEYALERFERMGSFYKKHPLEGQLDDITWNDLGMNELFKRMNYTLSASGEEYLYYVLRTLRQDAGELEHLEEVIGFIAEHPDERVNIQFAISKLGYTGKYSLYDYLDNLELMGDRSSRRHILQDLLFLPLIGLLWVEFSLGILGIVILIIYNIFTYFREKGEIDPYITSFSYIMRLMHTCGELEKCGVPVCGEEWKTLRNARKQLHGMKQNSYWVMSPQRGNSSGDILSVFLDYIRMVFHADLIKFNSMLKVLRGHIKDVDDMIGVVGYLETAISIWAFRESLTAADSQSEESSDDKVSDKKTSSAGEIGAWCVPEFLLCKEGLSLTIEEGYHPILTHPVKNGIAVHRGVLLTGSNASGKSTFLKTVAINTILAQTIHTCAAGSYRAPFFHVYSSMALRDDISSGESYYIVEIKALKRILDAAAGVKVPVLCFVDEVLRGTNTVERIAASTQILKSLSQTGILCFAATHDIELTELLQEDYDNYHFEEDVRDGDVFFNYKLKQGKASTRNAIKLLELMGYDRDIIEKASSQAVRFVSEGPWS